MLPRPPRPPLLASAGRPPVGLAPLHVAGLVAGLVVSPGCGDSPAPPNVAVIVVDTLRADHLPFHGYERDTAPFLDRLASRSVVFDTAWSTSSWTAPATASLFTGRYPSQHGVLTGLSLFRRNQAVVETLGAANDPRDDDPTWREMVERTTSLNAIPERLETLPELFAGRGYRTYAVADNVNVCEEEGFAAGFGRFDSGDYRGATEVVDRALRWKDEMRSGEAPFFLYVHLMDPHQPYHDRAAEFDWDACDADTRAWLEATIDASCPHCEAGEASDADGSAARSLSTVRAARYREIQDPALRERRRAAMLRLLSAFYDSEIRHADREIERLVRELRLDAPDTVLVVTRRDHRGRHAARHLARDRRPRQDAEAAGRTVGVVGKDIRDDLCRAEQRPVLDPLRDAHDAGSLRHVGAHALPDRTDELRRRRVHDERGFRERRGALAGHEDAGVESEHRQAVRNPGLPERLRRGGVMAPEPDVGPGTREDRAEDEAHLPVAEHGHDVGGRCGHAAIVRSDGVSRTRRERSPGPRANRSGTGRVQGPGPRTGPRRIIPLLPSAPARRTPPPPPAPSRVEPRASGRRLKEGRCLPAALPDRSLRPPKRISRPCPT